MTQYNLLDEPWIPCLTTKNVHEERSLRAVLRRPGEIREIVDPNPTVTVSLHRLLLAILHRVLDGPRNLDEWADLWEAGTYETGKVEEYLDTWHERFELFHPERPFYQSTDIDMKYEKPITKLTPELASGSNAATLFDHSIPEQTCLTPATAARCLLAHQNFAVGGLVSGTGKEKYATAGPLCKTAVCLVKGNTLFETLLLNLVPYNPEEATPFAVEDRDLPAWEQEAGPRPMDRRPSGYLDLLTWQPRRILLIPGANAGDSQSGVSVASVVIMKGYQFSKDLNVASYETMVPFERSSPKKPFTALFLREDRTLWRDSIALLQTARNAVDVNKQAPRTVRWLADLVVGEVLKYGETVPTDVYGLTTDRAKVLFWRHERFPVPAAILSQPVLLKQLQRSLQLAEDVGDLLGGTVRQVVQAWLPEGSADVRDVVTMLAPDRRYWPRLDNPFFSLLNRLARAGAGEHVDTVSPDVDRGGAEQSFTVWANSVRAAARSAFEESINGIQGTPRGIPAVGSLEGSFYGRMYKLTDTATAVEQEVAHG